MADKQKVRMEISEEVLETIFGGNDDVKGKFPGDYACIYCGAMVHCKQRQDMAKHLTKDCPTVQSQWDATH